MTGEREPLVSAVVVNYNVRELLLECVAALYATVDLPLEVIVVDNASSDGSAEAVASAFPRARLIRMPRNAGFGVGNNEGLQVARGRFVLLINPDVTVSPAAVGRLADFLLVHADAGAVGPRVRRPDGRLDLASRRGFPTPSTAFYRLVGLSRLFPRSARFNRYNMGYQPESELQEVDAGTGACLMVRRTAMERVGYFDTDFFMYGEDLDLCFRLKKAGWKVFYQPAAEVTHVKGSSSRQATQRMLREFHRSMWTFHDKHYADDMSAFGNGIVWFSIWVRWAVLAARAALRPEVPVSP